MLKFSSSVLVFVCALSFAPAFARANDVGSVSSSIVYGTDDRCDVYAYSDDLYQNIARESVVALILKANLSRRSDGHYDISSGKEDGEKIVARYGELNDLCENERFWPYPAAAGCSGVLIESDVVATAGHCVTDLAECQSWYFTFDYYLSGEEKLATIRDSDLYECQSIIGTSERHSPADTDVLDLGFVRLNRPVDAFRKPVTIRPPKSDMVVDEPLWLIGTGGRLPLTIADNAKVYLPNGEGHALYNGVAHEFFIANADAFVFHSGSPVFDAVGRFSGILILGGSPDFVFDNDDGCHRVNVVPDASAGPGGGQGEVIHHIDKIMATYCMLTANMPALCSHKDDLLDPADPIFTAVNTATCSQFGGGGGGGCALANPLEKPQSSQMPVLWWFMLALVVALAALRRRASSY